MALLKRNSAFKMKFLTFDAGSCFDSAVRNLKRNNIWLKTKAVYLGSIIQHTCRTHPKLAVNHRY